MNTDDRDHKPKMAPHPDAPPGLEQDGLGNPIPFDKRTPEDKEKAQLNIVEKMHSDSGVKNPEGEAEHPAPMPEGGQGRSAPTNKPKDPAGQQGSNKH